MTGGADRVLGTHRADSDVSRTLPHAECGALHRRRRADLASWRDFSRLSEGGGCRSASSGMCQRLSTPPMLREMENKNIYYNIPAGDDACQRVRVTSMIELTSVLILALI